MTTSASSARRRSRSLRSAVRATSVDGGIPRCYACRRSGLPAVSSAAMSTEIDPVCGMEVETTTSQLKLEHDGKTYWFCGRGCLLEFRDDPDKYLDPDYVPSM